GAVVGVVEAFEIDLVGDDPGPQEVEHFGRGVAVGDEGAGEPGGAGLAENGDGPFGGDQRLVVAGDDQAGPFAPGGRDELAGTDGPDRSDRILITQCLRCDPILTITAMQVATHHAEGEGVAAGVDVEERLLLDGVALQTGDVAERHLEPAGLIEAHLADAAQAVADEAAMAARQTTNAVAFEPG